MGQAHCLLEERWNVVGEFQHTLSEVFPDSDAQVGIRERQVDSLVSNS
jgi:hypothetical protein